MLQISFSLKRASLRLVKPVDEDDTTDDVDVVVAAVVIDVVSSPPSQQHVAHAPLSEDCIVIASRTFLSCCRRYIASNLRRRAIDRRKTKANGGGYWIRRLWPMLRVHQGQQQRCLVVERVMSDSTT